MRGRSMAGWLRVDAGDVADDAALAEWVELGTGYAACPPAEVARATRGNVRRNRRAG